MESKNHWEKVYSTKAATDVSWFQEQAQPSLSLIGDANSSGSASIIDVGGGASTLVDGLLANGYENVTVLDLSKAALNTAKARLGLKAEPVRWLDANVLEVEFAKNTFDVWHDRAVFHFLTTQEERQAYVCQVLHSVKPGGTMIIATFAEDGPTQCSGLPVMRYSAAQLQAEFGQPFELIGHKKELHRTPGGSEQQFIYGVFKKVANA
ncbi:MAG TPA: class I SAM-dependent methyltransferase [Marinagarivorans sp.]